MSLTRRELGKLTGSAAVAAAPPACRKRREPAAPPNLLVIQTPHLDALARAGLRFTDGYAAAPVCSPTRLALDTGRYPGRLHAGLEEPIIRPDPQIGLPPCALRRGRWKYLRTVVDASPVDALYDLEADVGESSDQATTQPDRLRELRARCEEIDGGLLPYPRAG